MKEESNGIMIHCSTDECTRREFYSSKLFCTSDCYIKLNFTILEFYKYMLSRKNFQESVWIFCCFILTVSIEAKLNSIRLKLTSFSEAVALGSLHTSYNLISTHPLLSLFRLQEEKRGSKEIVPFLSYTLAGLGFQPRA